ncbi:hypothetical protein [Zavarzinella formosa]|uniref:hypothetical protein n=1 Tax=Zavarzinella formosa TaxID=360055 RepID=UPI000318EA72|nr:hypothetical protein [Zavarzinella formosa]
MSDMLKAIVPKSDQLNADSLAGGRTKTITVTKVIVKQGEQPVTLHYEDDNGRPFKPCKSMCRVLVELWGADGNKYAGRSMTLYCDPTVRFGTQEVGGIRISHMSHIERAETILLTVTKGVKKPFTVQPLVMGPTLAETIAEIEKAATLDALKAVVTKAGKAFADDESRAAITVAKDKRKAELTPKTDDEGTKS